MREGLGVDRYTKTVLTLIAVLLAALLCKPFFVGELVTAYTTTADDAYYHADEAYYLAQEALEKAEEAYSYADDAYSRAWKAYRKAEESSSQTYRAENRADEAYEKAEEAWNKAKVANDDAYYYANNAYNRAKRELSEEIEMLAKAIGFLVRSNREDLIKIGEKFEIAVSSLEELVKEFEETIQPEE